MKANRNRHHHPINLAPANNLWDRFHNRIGDHIHDLLWERLGDPAWNQLGYEIKADLMGWIREQSEGSG